MLLKRKTKKNEARELILKVHKSASDTSVAFVKRYDVSKTFKDVIPGLHASSAKKKSKADNLEVAVGLWLHLIKWDNERKGFVFLQLSMPILNDLLSTFNPEHFGSGFDLKSFLIPS